MTWTKEQRRAYGQAWYQRNKEAVKARAKAWAKAHPERRAKIRAPSQERSRLRARDKFPERSLFQAAKARAKRRGREFSITLADIVIPPTCPILGIEIDRRNGGKGGKPNSASLDRIDSSKGYIPGNVQVISWRANSLKKNATADEIAALHAYMQRTK